MAKAELPVPGDPIRVPPSARTRGGLATVESMEGNFVHVAEVPDWAYHIDYLRPLQGKLKKRFGNRPTGPLAPGEEPEKLDPPEVPGLF